MSLVCTALTVCAMVVKIGTAEIGGHQRGGSYCAAKMLPAMIAFEVSPEPPRR